MNEWSVLLFVLKIDWPILVRIMPNIIQLRERTNIQIKEPMKLNKEPNIKILRRPIKSAKNEMIMQLTAETTKIINWELLLSTDLSQKRSNIYAMLLISEFNHVLNPENTIYTSTSQIYWSVSDTMYNTCYQQCFWFLKSKFKEIFLSKSLIFFVNYSQWK